MSSKVTHDGERWSNADEDRIEIVKYNPEWPDLFQVERQLILSVVPYDIDFTIEHFGSTAIPGMSAKPIIDICVICKDQNLWERFIKPLESLQFVFWENNPRTDRMFFVKGMPPFGEKRTHHVHVRKSEDIQSELLFRDFMKHHPKEAQKYAVLKREMMNQYETDRDAYTNAKKEFIETIIAKAKVWGGV